MEYSDGQQQAPVLKRKRSGLEDLEPSALRAKPSSNHLAINYLARQYPEDLPLISPDDNLPAMLTLLNEYHGVLERHESMACNLGARPLGLILINRFERLFDGPPKLLKCHGKEGTSVTWLDVVEFARNKPEQFTLGQMSEGVRVCQFYTKQCRVQITEEDFVLISSNIPQKLIPPQPIIEDEDKEVGTLETLDNNLNTICASADQVAARIRQLRHRINARKQAILDRRATDTGVSIRAPSPSNIALINGNGGPQTPGFVPVNARQVGDYNGGPADLSQTGPSDATRNELRTKFFTTNEYRVRPVGAESNAKRRASSSGPVAAAIPNSAVRPATATATTTTISQPDPPLDQYGFPIMAHATIPPNPPSPFTPSAGIAKENEGPHKTEMVTRMEAIKRGERIMPPCDRCRRLHMDCIKNLTACLGCTRKHAKCSWKDVQAEELLGGPISFPEGGMGTDKADREPSVGYPQSDAMLDGGSHSAAQGGSNGNGIHVADNPNVGGSIGGGARALTVNATTAAGLAAVAQASSSAMESSEAEAHIAQQYHHQLSHQGQLQSPNHVTSRGHQVTNVQAHGSYSPDHQSHASINVGYAPGPHVPSPGPGYSVTEPTSNATLRHPHPSADREALGIRPGEGLLAS